MDRYDVTIGAIAAIFLCRKTFSLSEKEGNAGTELTPIFASTLLVDG